jgi:hypothetical protein
MLKRQLPDGAWKYPGGGKESFRATEDYNQADSQVRKALDWLTDMQQEDGLWRLCLLRAGGDRDLATWVSLAICRVFKRLGVQNGR